MVGVSGFVFSALDREGVGVRKTLLPPSLFTKNFLSPGHPVIRWKPRGCEQRGFEIPRFLCHSCVPGPLGMIGGWRSEDSDSKLLSFGSASPACESVPTVWMRSWVASAPSAPDSSALQAQAPPFSSLPPACFRAAPEIPVEPEVGIKHESFQGERQRGIPGSVCVLGRHRKQLMAFDS